MADCPLYTSVKTEFEAMVASYKEAYSDGSLEFTEVLSIIGRAGTGIVSLVSKLRTAGTTSEDRAECVLHCIEKFYDEVIAPIDIKAIPNLFEGYVDNAARDIILSVTKPFILQLLNLLPSPTSPDNSDDDSDDGGADPSPNVLGCDWDDCTRPECN